MNDRALRYQNLLETQEDVAEAASAMLAGGGQADVHLGADQGWWAVAIPEAMGGAGGTVADLAPVLEEAGAVTASTALPWTAGVVAPLLASSSEDRAASLLEDIAAGTLATSVPARGQRLAKDIGPLDPDDAVDASVLALGPAESLVLPLVVSGASCLVAVDLGTPGVRATPVEGFDVSRPWTRYDLSGVALGSAVVARVPDLFARWQSAMGVMCGLDSAGAARAALARTVEYASVRQQFGRALGSYQAYKHRCATALVELKLAQSVAHRAAQAIGTPEELPFALASALQSTRSATAVCEAAIQLHGGMGFSWESGLHRYLRRARANEILVGGEDSAAMLLESLPRG
ncbi:acyl-CoA dehydrogenase family protein [Georgenia ruanii]|nr:acyl-CoA dehydrogenase family protein [Georgenia ruanii]MPV88521.1 hypothetical protein [Georgenia ruanii]